MVGGSSGTQDVKQRALQVSWGSRIQPTEEELESAFRPFGEIVRIQIKDLCAAVLFDSAESVAAAAESSWDSWDVRPMTKMTSKEDSTSLKAATKGRKHGTSIDRTTSSVVGRARASRSRTAVRGPKGVDLSAIEPGGSAISQENSDSQIEDAARMRNAYSSRSMTRSMTNVLSGDRVQEQRDNVRPNSKQWKTAQQQGQPADSSKESLRPVDDDLFTPRQRSSLSVSSCSDDGEGADAPINRSTRRSMRETKPTSRRGSSEDSPMENRNIGLHSTGGTSKTQQRKTPSNLRIVSRGAAEPVALVASNESDAVSCTPPNRDALDAASGENDVFWQNLSPLSSPEGLTTPMRERDKESERHMVDAEKAGSDPAVLGDGWSGSRALPTGRREHGEVSDGAVPPPRSEEMPEGSINSRHHAKAFHQLSERIQPRDDISGLSSPDTAPAAAIETAYPSVGEQAKSARERVAGRPVSKDQNKPGGSEGEGDDPEAEQKKARHQAKRLALEVARLRAALRRTASDLKAERTTRARVEEEWWKKMGKWEEERSSLVATKQEAERASREAAEETALVRKQTQTRQEKAVSDRDVREAVQCKADSAMHGVVEVQDRLVRALQAELNMTNRAREATQDDAREATEQLRFYVQDFLLWRDRAKRLQARMVELGHPEPWTDDIDGTPRSCVWPLVLTSPSAHHPTTLQRQNHDRRKAVQQPESVASNGDANDNNLTSRSDNIVGSADNSELKGDISDGPKENCAPGGTILPSKAQRGSGQVSGCDVNIGADTHVLDRHTSYFDAPQFQADPTIGAKLRGSPTSEVAPAWPSGRAVGGGQSPASRAYFQRSMEAQQEVSARLERDLTKARADLQAIYGGDKAKVGVGARVALLPREGGIDARNDMEGGHDVARDANSFAGTPGKEGHGNGNNDDPPLSDSGLATEGGDSAKPQLPTSQHNAIDILRAQASDSIPVNSRGPYMIRVLAALLGEDTIAKATAGLNGIKHPPVYDEMGKITERGRKNSSPVEAPPPSLRLTDFSPTLQAVFCGEESVLPSPSGAMSGRTLPPACERDGVVRRHQALRHQAGSGHHSNTGERKDEPSQTGTRFVYTAQITEHPGGSAPNISAALSQSSRDSGREKRYQEKTAAGAGTDLRGSAGCALAGAFREYEAKSPLLQRWMLERFPSPSAGAPVV